MTTPAAAQRRTSPAGLRSVSPAEPTPHYPVLLPGTGATPDPDPEQYSEIVSLTSASSPRRASWLATAIRELFDAGQAGEDGEVLELRWVVEDAVTDLLPVAQSAGCQVCYSPRSPYPVWFDAHRLRQGIFHLLALACFGRAWRGDEDRYWKSVAPKRVDADLSRADAHSMAHPRLDQITTICRMIWRGGWGWESRAIFEAAAGGSLRLEHGTDSLSVEVRLPRNGTRLSRCTQPGR